MDETKLRTIAQLQEFLAATAPSYAPAPARVRVIGSAKPERHDNSSSTPSAG